MERASPRPNSSRSCVFNACFLAVLFRNMTFIAHWFPQTQNCVIFFPLSLMDSFIAACLENHVPRCNKLTYPKYQPQSHFLGHFEIYPVCKHGPRCTWDIRRRRGEWHQSCSMSQSSQTQNDIQRVLLFPATLFLSLPLFLTFCHMVCVWTTSPPGCPSSNHYISFSPLLPYLLPDSFFWMDDCSLIHQRSVDLHFIPTTLKQEKFVQVWPA